MYTWYDIINLNINSFLIQSRGAHGNVTSDRLAEGGNEQYVSIFFLSFFLYTLLLLVFLFSSFDIFMFLSVANVLFFW